MGILVSDFDGTLTEFDFFDLVRRRWPIPPESDPWNQYLSGSITHFEALAAIFAGIRAPRAELEAMADEMHLDENLAVAMETLRRAGWEVVVASAGCAWYIDYLLGKSGVTASVYSNPGRLEPEQGLIMSHPPAGPFRSESTGVDKLAVMQDALQRSTEVAFAGDGRPDLAPALLVPSSRRFARGWLAEELTQRGEGFRPFQRWSQIPGMLAC